jgi:spermidine synthase
MQVQNHEVSLKKKVLSYFYPVTISEFSNEKHRKLVLQLFCNQFMLSTEDAVYSFGTFYTPFRKSFALIKDDIQNCNRFLLLGTGLGSALKILQKKYLIFPDAVLVDNDKDILELSMKFMDLNEKKNVEWIYNDAITYLKSNAPKFNLIGIDLFRGTLLSNDFKQASFFELCKLKLETSGICIFNMILNSTNEELIIKDRLSQHFSSIRKISFKQNTFFICRY